MAHRNAAAPSATAMCIPTAGEPSASRPRSPPRVVDPNRFTFVLNFFGNSAASIAGGSPLNQDLEAFAHAVGKDQVFHLQEPLHGLSIAGKG